MNGASPRQRQASPLREEQCRVDQLAKHSPRDGRDRLRSPRRRPAGTKDSESDPPTNPTETMFEDFEKRLDAYMGVRERLTDSIGDLDPTGVRRRSPRARTRSRTRSSRRAAGEAGRHFSPEVSAFLATLIKQEYSRRSEPVIETRDDQQEELPDFEPQVNQIYPTTYPLATFPPALLPMLPPLPEEIEYRIVRTTSSCATSKRTSSSTSCREQFPGRGDS